MFLFAVLSLVAGLLYLLFVDTMNRIQYVERLRLYWITRDDATPTTPRLSRAFMRQTAPPFWRGRGVRVRFRKWTFQVGILELKVDSLESQVSNIGGWLPTDPKRLRKWGA